ncbi:hypothetical protein [Streptomyces sp. NPDC058086]|uniref:hypothetical protein n=1 Tax=Streptomyces sp. NPDC058086 TaxID=3346334 RepID=UPI0036F12D0C
MADGTRKPIKDVRIGDTVLATDPQTDEAGPRTVTALTKGSGDKQLVDVTIDTDGPTGTKTGKITATESAASLRPSVPVTWSAAAEAWLWCTNHSATRATEDSFPGAPPAGDSWTGSTSSIHTEAGETIWEPFSKACNASSGATWAPLEEQQLATFPPCCPRQHGPTRKPRAWRWTNSPTSSVNSASSYKRRPRPRFRSWSNWQTLPTWRARLTCSHSCSKSSTDASGVPPQRRPLQSMTVTTQSRSGGKRHRSRRCGPDNLHSRNWPGRRPSACRSRCRTPAGHRSRGGTVNGYQLRRKITCACLPPTSPGKYIDSTTRMLGKAAL